MKTRRSSILLFGMAAVLLLAGFLTSGLVRTAASPGALVAASEVVFDDTLATGWSDWSWNTTDNFENSNPVHAGTASISVTYTSGWGGFKLHRDALDISAYDTLHFWLHGGSTGGQVIAVSLNQGGSSYQVTAAAGTWQEINIPLSALDSPASVTTILWQERSGSAQPAFYLDDIAFVNQGLPTPTPLPTQAGPVLHVNVTADRHSIRPEIYGMNFCQETLAKELNLPVRRRGGNSSSRYNWQIDVHNSGSDWYYENIPDANAYAASLPDGSATDRFVEQDRRTGTASLLTIPLIGWTPKPGAGSHPYDCAFKVSKYGTQDAVDPWDTDCGNGLKSGVKITGNDPLDTSMVITPTFVTGWINHLTGKYGTAANGGVKYYNLDNEPMLWNSTHRDIQPDAVTYDLIRDRTVAYAAAVKSADPSSKILGPVVWGWCAYFYSAEEGCSAGNDHTAHGNVDFIPWYLQQMAAYEQSHNVRLLDYLDVHIYPQIDQVYSANLGGTQVQAARLRSTRQLWDPTYTHEGWINQPVYLIPRMKSWVAENYPGTRTAITEYNWGAQGYMNGALAQADILGIFGREGLDLATLWGPPDSNQPAAFAFRMYLNYDGAGARFGDVSVHALSDDQERVAIYAAQRSSDAALTLMVINKTGQTQISTIALTNFAPALTAQVYRYSPANLSAIVRLTDQAVTAGGFTAELPANSITLFILKTGAAFDKHVFLPLVKR